MTEKEKMLNGELYDCKDLELMEIWNEGKNLMSEYNQIEYSDKVKQMQILDKLLGTHGENIQITAPFYIDYGKFIYIGNNCEINMDCVFLDCNTITIGNNTLIAPGVHIYTVFHPIDSVERFIKNNNEDGFPFAVSKSSPVKIGSHVWIGGRSVIMPGVTIGDNTVIGAGSVVTKSIPDNVLAYGNPCRVIKHMGD